MNLEAFVQCVEDGFAEFGDMESGTVTAQTEFKNLDDWSSFHALTLVTISELEFDVPLSGEEINHAVTIEDIYRLIQQKKTPQ